MKLLFYPASLPTVIFSLPIFSLSFFFRLVNCKSIVFKIFFFNIQILLFPVDITLLLLLQDFCCLLLFPIVLKYMQVYFDFMRSFRTEFDDLFVAGLICAVEIGLGPSGELKYPSLSERMGWRYPGIGEFQVSAKAIYVLCQSINILFYAICCGSLMIQ